MCHIDVKPEYTGQTKNVSVVVNNFLLLTLRKEELAIVIFV